ncbi:MAG TPA: carbohydrate kinase family protein [Steroidobacteraceae bacterium]|jgi:adenosine kinase|nr:carbohydrate kinase family protein [Steroidobacteraceae bacterium]
MTALICGSLAYDTVMVFPGRFREHILPESIHMLNVSFLVPSMKRNFGGCSGNIAYNLRLLGGEGAPMATVGTDFGVYAQWLTDCGVRTDHVLTIEGEFTAQAFITTDLDANQINAFHPGAMDHSHRNQVPLDAGVTLGVIAPDGREGMLAHSMQFAAAGVPVLFDPGQQLPRFDRAELLGFVERSRWIAVNDYEAQLLRDRTGEDIAMLAKQVDALIITRGAQGSVIMTGGREIAIPAARPDAVVDPTGCGDAYRAGLIYGLMRGLDWETTGRIASLLGALKIAHAGTQNHRFTAGEFAARFRAAFGRAI